MDEHSLEEDRHLEETGFCGVNDYCEYLSLMSNEESAEEEKRR